ncbi:beta-N-acetylhexosaminidase [Simplicispira metamorpha]|uniref:Beta-hexosaminidase n=1 Tax=Simplicispira metamorpha TaxID=80881 RepID=A0A4R2NA93_9BURK|nr:beta-N-acetylhexosaminidase [Simplicispira metamorpha]TCP17999.1 beta-N-acetylhexosaminidase [Simplicispira metamorpha]
MTEHAPLIIDIAGTSLTDTDRRRLAHPLTGGVILFARNWQDRAQLLELTAAMKAVRPDLLICVDHEGGRVQRFRSDGFTHLAPMRALGEMWRQDGKKAKKGKKGQKAQSAQTRKVRLGEGALRATNAATAAGYVLASELRACGVDFSFTPVLDLDWGGSGVIGDRAFDRDPRIATLLAKSLAQGLLQAGMANCGKHFPGHGYVKADSHTEVPIDKRSLKKILAADAAPYQWLRSTITSVMPAHVIYPKVDTRPAGFSTRWLQDILRSQLGFDGAIFSDDLSMEGARRIDGQVVSYTEAAVAALQAGCDLVLLCNQSLGDGAAVDELLDGLSAQQAQGRWQPSPESESRRLALLPQTPPLPWDELMFQPAYLQALEMLP